MSKQLRKVENNVKYVREQIERFMRYEYKVNYKIEVYGNKRIEKEGYFSRIEFKKGRPVAVDISYRLLAKGKKEDILKAGLREAIKIAFWYKRLSYHEMDKGYMRELMRYNLPVYGDQPQVGKYMHPYGCGKCKRIYVLRERKIVPSKDITQQRMFTKCCGERFVYEGKTFYTGEKLFKIATHLRNSKG